ncbi:MAG: transposase [Elusimicrobiota bacterium]|nr:transposase [Elusimicrobiota bacterium]
MPYRNILAVNSVYHVFTKSIAGYKIFNSEVDYKRIIGTIAFYNQDDPESKFSVFWDKNNDEGKGFDIRGGLAKLIAYCIMPTHIHLVLSPLKEDCVSKFMNRVLKSYSKYFNVKHNRKGPLWEGRFKSVLVNTDEQLQHLTRYVHLNPVTSYLVDKPDDWEASSYKEYIGKSKDCICDFKDYMDMNGADYAEFVNERKDYQRELAGIKHLILEP